MAENQTTKAKSIDDAEDEDVKVTNFGFKVLTIGVGQGGSKLAKSIAIALDARKNCVFMNTSKIDLDGIDVNSSELRVVKIGNEEIEGAGKDRRVADDILGKNRKEITDLMLKFANEDAYDFIFVVFSTAGGTGSGIGPKLTALMNTNQFIEPIREKHGKIPLVFGIAALPEISTNEGNISYENTLECLEEINKFTDKNIARFFLINNGATVNLKAKYADRISHLSEINLTTATILKRYLTGFGTSSTSSLDRADRIGALTTMGIHAFEMIDADGSRIQTPFFFPDGERVRRVCYEVPEKMENQALQAIAASGALSDDIIHGLYDESAPENSKLTPIIAYHGYKNVSKIAESYDKRLKLNRENAARIEKQNIYSATGLDDVAKEREVRNNEYGRHGADSIDDIFA